MSKLGYAIGAFCACLLAMLSAVGLWIVAAPGESNVRTHGIASSAVEAFQSDIPLGYAAAALLIVSVLAWLVGILLIAAQRDQVISRQAVRRPVIQSDTGSEAVTLSGAAAVCHQSAIQLNALFAGASGAPKRADHPVQGQVDELAEAYYWLDLNLQVLRERPGDARRNLQLLAEAARKKGQDLAPKVMGIRETLEADSSELNQLRQGLLDAKTIASFLEREADQLKTPGNI